MVLLSLVMAVGYSQTLVFGQSGWPVTLDTSTAQDGNSRMVSMQIAEPLVDLELGGTGLIPGLATEWTANEDATVWTFKLRQGVVFHDGTPFNAEAAKFNLDRFNDPAHPYGFRDQGKAYVPWGWIFGGPLGEGVLERVDIVDDYTVELHLTDSIGFLPVMLSSGYFAMHSPAAIIAAGPDYGTPRVGSVGTGPFVFKEWVEGERVLLERFDNYWGADTDLERIIIIAIEDPAARLAALRSGTLDIAVNLSPDDLAVIDADPNLVSSMPSTALNSGYLGMHQAQSPFNDVRVRQAVGYAIDVKAIVKALYGDLGVAATQFMPPGLFGYVDDITGYPYDPAKARELLDEAGYPDGFTTELWYMPVTRPYITAPAAVAEAQASYLAEVGIIAELKTEDWGTYLDDFTGKFPMYQLGWNAQYADPDGFLFAMFAASTAKAEYGWVNAEFEELLEKGRSAASESERLDYYTRAAQILYDEIPALPMAHGRALNATRANIHGFYPNPVGNVMPLYPITKE